MCQIRAGRKAEIEDERGIGIDLIFFLVPIDSFLLLGKNLSQYLFDPQTSIELKLSPNHSRRLFEWQSNHDFMKINRINCKRSIVFDVYGVISHWNHSIGQTKYDDYDNGAERIFEEWIKPIITTSFCSFILYLIPAVFAVLSALIVFCWCCWCLLRISATCIPCVCVWNPSNQVVVVLSSYRWFKLFFHSSHLSPARVYTIGLMNVSECVRMCELVNKSRNKKCNLLSLNFDDFFFLHSFPFNYHHSFYKR